MITNIYSFCQHCHVTVFQQLPDPVWYLAGIPASSTGCAASPVGRHEPAPRPTEDDYQAIVWGQPITGDTRACPDCGRPQHYTGTENGWAHDALIATWDCNDPSLYGSGKHPAGDQYGPADMTMYDRGSR